MKKIIAVGIVLVILLMIGKGIVTGNVSDLEKDIIASVKEGDYYTVLYNANEINLTGEKMSKKVSKVVEDVALYQAAEEELDKVMNMNLGRVKALLDEMNGSYKKYDIFKTDVENIKERVEGLEEYANEGVEVVEKAEKLIEKGKLEEARELLFEYKDDERYGDMPDKLTSLVDDLLFQISDEL